MTVEQAFRQGMEMVRAAGLPTKGTDVAILAAERVFRERAGRVMTDPRFPVDGPKYAYKLILEAYSVG